MKKILCILAVSMLCLSCSDNDSDSGNNESQTPVCGNGIVEDGEKCDDKNTESGDGCASDCKTIEDGYTCPSAGGKCTQLQVSPTCGNGVIDEGETCDDGNTKDGDGCSSKCFKEGKAFYTPNPGPETKCGDGKHEAGETCDPIYSGQYFISSIKRDCLVVNNSCVLSTVSDTGKNCGTGTVEADEQCDDGNTANGDGCSSKCKIENDSVCKMKNGAHGIVLLTVDGDTLKIRLDNGDCQSSGNVTVRLHGIDTPECAKETKVSPIDPLYNNAKGFIQSTDYSDKTKNEPFGYEASLFAENLIMSAENNGEVEIECETRSADDPTCLVDATNYRYLAYIKLKKDGKYVDLANEIIRNGYGMAMTLFTSQRIEKYCASEKAAVADKVGFWSSADTFEQAVKTNLDAEKWDYMLSNHCK